MNKLHEMNWETRLNHEVMPLTLQDMYKSFHVFATKPGVEFAYSNFTPRSGKHSNTSLTGVVSVGQQYFVKEILIKFFTHNFFNRPKEEVLAEYQYFVGGALYKTIDTSHIAALHDLGYLPLEVKVLPEGTFVPYGIPLLTMKNTVAGFGWLVGALEDEISAEIFPISTAATTALDYRMNFEASRIPKEMIPFMGHNFSYRGMMGHQAAAMVDFGHLTSFVGSDTTPGGIFAWKYYGADPSGFFEGRTNSFTFASVNATEHSVMCSYGEEDEREAIRHIMNNVSPEGILSLVCDAYDFWNVVCNYLPELKNDIMKRNGTLVIRPDSGDPVDIICGRNDVVLASNGKYYATKDWITESGGYMRLRDSEDKLTPVPEHEVKGLIGCLWDIFGGTTDEYGYRTIDSHIGAIYGDSITLERQVEIIKRLQRRSFIPTCVLGIGSYTYQYVTRDTHGFAMKCTAIKFKGKRNWTPIFKSPKTDPGKKSAKGLMMVAAFNEGTTYRLVQDVTAEEETRGALETIFLDGKLTKEVTLEDIRTNIAKAIKAHDYWNTLAGSSARN